MLSFRREGVREERRWRRFGKKEERRRREGGEKEERRRREGGGGSGELPEKESAWMEVVVRRWIEEKKKAVALKSTMTSNTALR